jgi:glycosyltransferase involved in cell wall biosynthesis
MKRVLLCANTDWYLYNFRLALARYLRRQGLEVILVSPSGAYTAALEADGFRWLHWEVGRKSTLPWQELPALLRLAAIYRQVQPDLVHHHTIKPVLYGSIAARLAGVPRVINSITGRGYIFLGEGRRARLLRLVVSPIYRLALKPRHTTVIFENRVDRDYFIQHRLVAEVQTRLIEGVGVDPERYQPFKEPPGPPVVVLAARMLWDKGVGVFVEAARLLKASHPEARFVLTGIPDPGNPSSISEQVLQDWHHAGDVEWWGWQANMPAVYQQCHIVTLPTFYGEGVPTTLLEAAACARPLVATDTPGCDQVVEEGVNGFRVPPNDASALAQALQRLLVDPSLRGRMGQASRELVLQKFTHEHINQATYAVYQEGKSHQATATPTKG